MFKKFILLVLIALLAIPAITGCSKSEQPAAPAASAAAEEKPANPTTSPAPATTPPEKVSEKDPEKAISVPEFIGQVENGRYKAGDIVLVSGIVEMALDLEEKDLPSNKSSLVRALVLGPETNSLEVRVFLKEPAKVKIGDKVTVKGEFYAVTPNDVRIRNGVVQ